MIYKSLVKCPFCGHSNTVNIKENQGLMSLECQSCNKIISGKENPHGGNGVLCAYGSVPGLQIQERDKKSIYKNQGCQ